MTATLTAPDSPADVIEAVLDTVLDIHAGSVAAELANLNRAAQVAGDRDLARITIAAALHWTDGTITVDAIRRQLSAHADILAIAHY